MKKTFDTSRNWGFISKDQQEQLARTTVAIAGVGGVGGRVVVELTRLGVGRLKIADPDTFSATNSNRQEGSYASTLDKNKAEVIANICRDINPEVEIQIFPEGVNSENLERFMNNADILIEATDYMLPHLGVMLARAARNKGIPMITSAEVGFGAAVFWFHPQGAIYERHLGLKPDVDLAELEQGKYSVDVSRWIPRIPSYGKINVLQQVANGSMPAPAVSPAVGLSSAMISTHVISLLAGDSKIPPSPACYVIDAKDLRSRIIRRPHLHYYVSLGALVIKSFFIDKPPAKLS